MPEGSEDATLLIAASWQALNRAISGNRKTLITDCTVLILFAAFFIEANLNYVIEELNQTAKMKKFLNKPYPGLQDKLGWFYNKYVARSKAQNKDQLYRMGITKKLRRKYPGFAKLYRFRNDISHGSINKSAKSLREPILLRSQAKQIVDDVFKTASKSVGYDIPRVVTYSDAINSS